MGLGRIWHQVPTLPLGIVFSFMCFIVVVGLGRVLAPGSMLDGQPQQRRRVHPRRGPEALPVERAGRQHVREVQGGAEHAAHQGQ